MSDDDHAHRSDRVAATDSRMSSHSTSRRDVLQAGLLIGSAATGVGSARGQSADDTAPPTAPTDLRVTERGPTYVDLTWTAATDEGRSGLYLYGVDVRKYPWTTEPGDVTSTSIGYLPVGWSGTIGVIAYDGAGNASERATIEVATEPDTQAPEKPQNPSVNDNAETELSVYWDAASDAGGTGVARYEVFLGDDPEPATTTTETATRITGLTTRDTFDVRVVAVDGAGNRSPAATVTATLIPQDDTTGPTPPENVRVTGTTETTVTVSWDAATDRGDAGVEWYSFYVNEFDTDDVEYAVSADGRELTATIDDLRPHRPYDILVVARGRAENYSDPVSVSAVPGGDLDDVPPEPPADVTLSTSDGSHTQQVTGTLTWTAPDDPGPAELSHYLVCVVGGEGWTVSADTTSVEMDPLRGSGPVSERLFAVAAVDEALNRSKRAIVAPPDSVLGPTPLAGRDPPAPPRDVSANAYNPDTDNPNRSSPPVADLTWSPPREDETVAHYRVSVVGGESKAVPAETTETSLELPSLTYTHEIAVSAIGADYGASERVVIRKRTRPP